MPSGMSPPSTSLVAIGIRPNSRVTKPMIPTPITLPNNSGHGGTIASSTSLMRFAFSIATPFTTEIVRVNSST